MKKEHLIRNNVLILMLNKMLFKEQAFERKLTAGGKSVQKKYV